MADDGAEGSAHLRDPLAHASDHRLEPEIGDAGEIARVAREQHRVERGGGDANCDVVGAPSRRAELPKHLGRPAGQLVIQGHHAPISSSRRRANASWSGNRGPRAYSYQATALMDSVAVESANANNRLRSGPATEVA